MQTEMVWQITIMIFSQTITLAKPLYTIQKQSQEDNYTQHISKPVPQSVFFNEKQKTLTDRTENHLVIHQNKNLLNKQFIRNQQHYSEDEDYFNQNQQQNSNFPQKINLNFIDQPDNFHQPDFSEPYMNLDETRQSLPQRQNLVQSNSNIRSQNQLNTQGFNHIQMQNKFLLP